LYCNAILGIIIWGNHCHLHILFLRYCQKIWGVLNKTMTLVLSAHKYLSKDERTNPYITKYSDDIIGIPSLSPEVIMYIQGYLLSKNKQVLETSIDGMDVIVKVAGYADDQQEIRNEALVWQQLRKLDDYHFAPIIQYGVIMEIDVVVYRKIVGVSLEEYVETCDVKALCIILRELFSTLHNAEKILGFTHYDMHLQNVLVTTEGYPVVIDYGLSYVASDPRTGTYNRVGHITPTTWWAHDVIKVLFMLYEFTNIPMIQEENEIFRVEETDVIKFHCSELSGDRLIDALQRAQLVIHDKLVNIWSLIKDMNEDDESNKFYTDELYDEEYEIRIQARRELCTYMIEQHEIRCDKKIIKINSRVSTYAEINQFLRKILGYFGVNMRYTIVLDPDEYVPYVRSKSTYYAVSRNNTMGGSFDDFIKRSAKYLIC
jgi:hypothetical protein